MPRLPAAAKRVPSPPHPAVRKAERAARKAAAPAKSVATAVATKASVTSATPANPATPAPTGIVSSAHLASPTSMELSEFEFGMIVAWNAFSRWVVRCMAAAGCPDLTITDVLILHHLQHRARNKKIADICFVLNYEDTHVVAYSLKKLVAADLVLAEKVGKEVFYSPSPTGEAFVQQYRVVREACLVANLDGERNADIGALARTLRTMSGMYDQAARAATSL